MRWPRCSDSGILTGGIVPSGGHATAPHTTLPTPGRDLKQCTDGATSSLQASIDLDIDGILRPATTVTHKVNIAQGVSTSIVTVDSKLAIVPFMMQAVKQKFQDDGTHSVPEARCRLYSSKQHIGATTVAASK
eukprot:jgi/Ulvmu1/9151/UM005_0249.1